ncbi:MAG: ABC transporter ATP-binding protein, partial [Kineosporiaceae bacterium]
MRSPTRRPVVALTAARKTYGRGETAVHALDGVDLTIERGEYVAI